MEPSTAASRISESILRLLDRGGPIVVGISAGPLLSPVLRALSTEPLPWDRVRFVMTDEIAGSPADPRSRYRLAYEALFSRIGFRPGRVLRFWSEGAPPETVTAYFGQMVALALELPPGEAPRLDLVLLELSPDGSVGSFIPGSPALDSGGVLAHAVEIGGEVHFTIGGDAIRRAREVIVVGAGPEARSPVLDALRPLEGEAVFLPVAETGVSTPASQS